MDPVTNAAPTAPAIDTAAPVVLPPAATVGAPVNMTSDLLKTRLDEARNAATAKVLRDLGVADIEAAKAVIAAAKAAEEAQLSDAQKYQRTVDELRPRAERATALEAQVTAFAQRELAALSDAARAAVTRTAGEDPVKILATIDLLREAGLLGGNPVVTTPAPATSAAPANAPRPIGGQTKFDEWAGRKGMAADIFYGLHKAEIERTRPAGQ